MAEEIDSPESGSHDPAAGLTRRARSRRTVAPASTRPASPAPRAKQTKPAAGTKAKPLRSLLVLSVVGGLVATAALPAFAATLPESSTMTLQQVALDDAQSLVVASDATSTTLKRDSYSATTPEEIAKKKAAEAAAKRARLMAASAASVSNIDVNLVAPGSGAVRYPLASWSYNPAMNGFRTSARPGHNGLDMMAPSGRPIFAAAAGVVRQSTDSGGSYGAVVIIDSVVGGKKVTTTYAHMIYGSRLVKAGQSVAVGQVIGQVGRTGNASATHCHFEVKINGGLVDPLAWLKANAG